MATPDTAIVDQLDADGTLTLTKGTDLFEGPVRADLDSIPTECVFALATNGGIPLNYLDNSKTPQVKFFVVQVRVRGDRQDFAGARTLARAVRDALHDVPPTGYYRTRVRESEPDYLGMTEIGSHEFVMNVEMEIEES